LFTHQYLEQLSTTSGDDEKEELLRRFMRVATPLCLQYFVRLVYHDLRMAAQAKHVLGVRGYTLSHALPYTLSHALPYTLPYTLPYALSYTLSRSLLQALGPKAYDAFNLRQVHYALL
jgi:hypothetical protein